MAHGGNFLSGRVSIAGRRNQLEREWAIVLRAEYGCA